MKAHRVHTPAYFMSLLMIASFLVGCLPANSVQMPLVARNVQPFLNRLAQEEPADLVRVIIQMQRTDNSMEGAIHTVGGQVVRALPMIQALVADLPAQAIPKLAQRQSVRWISLDAPVRKMSAESEGILEVSDDFNTIVYSGNDGTQQWMGDWQEVGELDGAQEGNVAITPFWGGALQGLRLQGSRVGATRQVDLTAASSAQLNLAYRRKDLLDSEQGLMIAVSKDGGSSWQEIGRINGPATDTEIQYASYDLSALTHDKLLIQLLTSDRMDEASKVYLDSVQVKYTLDPEVVASQRKVYLPVVSAGNSNQLDSSTESTAEPLVHAAAYSTANLASTYVKAIGADRVWTESPYYTGNNVRIAVVDSGISEHADLKIGTQSRILTHVNFGPTTSTPDDNYGHGTHVAGIMGGNGAMSTGKYMGVAPDAKFIDIKVTDDNGSGSTSNLVSGLQWILNNKSTYNIRIVNLSINSSVPDSYLTSPLCAAVEILWFNGIVTVVSAGNAGAGKLNPPANDPFIITVGSMDDMGTATTSDDTLSKFSSYNITEDGFVKPDLVAPGRDIVSLLSADDNNLATNHSSNKLSGTEGLYYYRMSGTSMASAVLAGAAAILLQKEPTLTPDQVKYRLLKTAKPVTSGQSCAVGAGYLDIYAATHTATSASANTGIKANQLLWSGSTPVTWSSVNWNSVNWNSVNWNSVNWNSVNWNSVNWNSVNWNSNESGGASQGSCSDISTYGLLGQWRLNESGNTVAADASGNNNVGTLLNGAVNTPAGRVNGAVIFDGSNDSIAIPSSSSLNSITNSLTLSAWLYLTSSPSTWQNIITRQYGTGLYDQFSLGINGNSYCFVVTTATNGQITICGGTKKLNEWVHVAGVYDGSTMKLFVNGVQAGLRTAITGNIRIESKPLYIGAGANSTDPSFLSEFTAGIIDDVRLYNRSLSDSEVNTLYKGIQNPGTSRLIYDESLAADWTDWSWDSAVNYSNTSNTLSGSKSIALTYNAAWAGFYLTAKTPISTSGYSTMRFRVRGGTNNSLLLGIYLNHNTYEYFVTAYANQWIQVDVPLATFGNPSTITDIMWQNKSTTAQPTFYIDQIELVP